MSTRSDRTLITYGLTQASFAALFAALGGRCAICGIHEDDLAKKYTSDDCWDSDRKLHIDHAHDNRANVRGLSCRDCNFALEAYLRGKPMWEPGRRQLHYPSPDLRFNEYLSRSGGTEHDRP